MNVSFSITINLKNQCHHKPFYFPDSSEHLSGHHFCSPSWHSITFFYICKYNARYTSGFYFFFFFFFWEFWVNKKYMLFSFGCFWLHWNKGLKQGGKKRKMCCPRFVCLFVINLDFYHLFTMFVPLLTNKI